MILVKSVTKNHIHLGQVKPKFRGIIRANFTLIFKQCIIYSRNGIKHILYSSLEGKIVGKIILKIRV